MAFENPLTDEEREFVETGVKAGTEPFELVETVVWARLSGKPINEVCSTIMDVRYSVRMAYNAFERLITEQVRRSMTGGGETDA